MKITNLRTEVSDTHIIFHADCKVRPYAWDKVYFKFDKKYKDDLTLDGSPLAAAFLIPAMREGEDLEVDGVVSERLLAGMHKFMDEIIGWKWEVPLKRVNIKVKGTTKDPYLAGKSVATFFSGGVDSFYTFLKHQHDAQDPIDHFILIKGADIELRNEDLWEVTLSNIQAIAEKSHIELVVVESNFQEFMEPMIDQGYSHGGFLAAVGLCMRKRFKKIYIPATFSHEQNIPWGSHPKIDHFWGTETINFEHDGAEATRNQKVEWQIAKSPLALEHLRVCYMNEKDKYNCGVCEKCCRTMLELAAVGKLQDAKTFPRTLNLEQVERNASDCGMMYIGYEELLRTFEKNNLDPAAQEAIKKGLARNDRNHMEIHDRHAKALIRLDHIYLHGLLRSMLRKVKR